MHDEHVRDGKAIQQETGKTFHLATRLLPERIRHPTYVLYGFFRIADEIVDDPDGTPPAVQARELESLRRQALGEDPADEPVLEAFAEICETYDIDDEWVNEFVDAMAADIDTDRYETYEDLSAYMRGSAAAVGVMMTDIMELDDAAYEQAIPHAVTLGEAFQLSNFVRDVHEDVVERDRVYLPVETLEARGTSVEAVKELAATPEIRAAIAAETARADALYREGVKGIRYLPEDCQLAVLLAAVLYAEHHRVIRNRGYDTVSEDVDLPTWRKLWCLLRTRWHWQWTDDPVEVFKRVSAVPYPDEEVTSPGDVPARDHVPPADADLDVDPDLDRVSSAAGEGIVGGANETPAAGIDPGVQAASRERPSRFDGDAEWTDGGTDEYVASTSEADPVDEDAGGHSCRLTGWLPSW